MIFKGSFEHTLDAKGRMFVPAKFREGLGEQFVIFKWLDQCLYMMSNEAFENFSSELKGSLTDEDIERIERVLYPSACDVELDAQKRILIPAELRSYAHLDKDVAVVGMRTRVALWNLETWKEMQQQDADAVKASIGNLRSRGHNI